MTAEVIVTAYGRPASQGLAAAIQRAKDGRALAPVTVVVPSNFAGLASRRLLGSGVLGDPRGRNESGAADGIANVNFFTPFRLAELLASGQLGRRRPLTNPVLGAAVRRALADDPRHFRSVRDHHATEQALAAVVGELGNVSEQGLAAIESEGGDSANVVALYRSVKAHLSGFHDEGDVALAARHRADLADALTPYGHVIWYLPGALSAPLAGLMNAVLAAAPSTVIIGASGTPAADREVARTLRIAGLTGSFSNEDQPLADHIISVTDADEEVRAVIREIVQLVDAGTPLDRIGVFHPAPDPYVRILEQQFKAADLPANGPSRRRLSETIAGRVLTAALALPSERWRRDRVMALISSGPIRHGDGSVRPAAWESISRQAGVVRGLKDWRFKLQTHQGRTADKRAEAQENGHERTVARLAREHADLQELAAFVDTLAEHLDRIDQAKGWQAICERATELLHLLLGPAYTHSSWPDEAERVAFERVEQALERLALLEDIDPAPKQAVFMRALAAELSLARDRSGRFGHGVVYGPLASAVGHDLDAVFILGCTEGLCPTPRREDSLLPDRARRLTEGDLVERLNQIDEQHRTFLAALSAAPVGRRWLFLPRGDLRSSRRSRPSRWLLPTASQLAGQVLYATNFEHDSPKGVYELPSHAGGLVKASHYASINERDVADVYRYVLQAGDAIDHPAADSVRQGLLAQRLRNDAAFTEFDGNLAGQSISVTDQRFSATRLENWATCGFRYFLGHVLGLSERDEPEDMIELSALDRGSAMHEILEVFMREMVEQGAPAVGAQWTLAQRLRAREIALAVFDDYDRRGRTGRPVLWSTQKTDLLALIDEFMSADDEFREANRAEPFEFEFAFGLRDQPPLEIELDADRILRFRGMIDRVDRGPDGRLFVSDYKTGKGTVYKELSPENPTMHGKTLQLGLYAEAVRQMIRADGEGRGAAAIETHYWMVNSTAGHARIGYEWGEPQRKQLQTVLTAIVDGIETGVFAAVPGEWESFRRTYKNCAYCQFDGVCPSARAEQAAGKEHAPELQVRSGLLGIVDMAAGDTEGATS